MSAPTVDTTEVPDLLEAEEHDQLRSALRDMLGAHCTTEQLLAHVASGRPSDPDLWTRVASGLGLAGLLVPEEYGGDGASTREAAIVCEELGRACAPVPYLGSAVLATVALVAAARDGSADAADLLPALAEGRATAALVVDATRGPLEAFPGDVTREGSTGQDSTGQGSEGRDSDDVVVTGTVHAVLGADAADTLVVPALLDGDAALVAVGAGAAAVDVGTALDATRPVATVTLDAAPARVLARGAAAEAALADALRAGAAMLAAEQVGVTEWALDTACDYLRVRHQFGRPIGSYQSLRHRAARMWIALGQARATVRYAAAALAQEGPGWGDEAAVATALAKAHATRISLEAVEDCLQMHGGIGFTWEHPLHLRLKRAFAAQTLLGDPARHRHDLGALLDIPGPDQEDTL